MIDTLAWLSIDPSFMPPSSSYVAVFPCSYFPIAVFISLPMRCQSRDNASESVRCRNSSFILEEVSGHSSRVVDALATIFYSFSHNKSIRIVDFDYTKFVLYRHSGAGQNAVGILVVRVCRVVLAVHGNYKRNDHLNGDWGGNGRMRPVIDQFEVLVTEVEYIVHLGIDLHLRRWHGLSGQLQVRLLQVVHIQVRVTQRMHELAGLQAGYPGNHQGEQGIGGDVERNTQENICAALVQLTGQGAVIHVELEEGMAGRKGHFVDLTRVPGADDHAPRVGVGLDLFHYAGNLVYGCAVGRAPCAPLHAVFPLNHFLALFCP